jgi:uncharacterized cupredoxin-like copper-binding protein
MSGGQERDTIRLGVLGGMAGYLAIALVVLAFGLAHMRTVQREREASAREVRVEASDFAFAPDEIVVTRGETISFVVTNTGTTPHEFRLTTQDEIDEHLAARHAGDDHQPDAPGVLRVEPGETASLLWTFDDAGDKPIDRAACLIPGHYETGMVATVRVTDRSP